MRRPCWTINHATEGIGGTYPQHQTMGEGYDLNAPDSVHKLQLNDFPDFEPNFRTVKIEHRAKLTDLISTVPIPHWGLLISGRFRRLLESFPLPPHRFFTLPMIHRKKSIEDYWWMHLPHPKIAIPDTSTSSEAEAIINADPVLKDVELLSLYRPRQFSYFFCSDPLRKAMEAAKITGVRFGTARMFR